MRRQPQAAQVTVADLEAVLWAVWGDVCGPWSEIASGGSYNPWHRLAPHRNGVLHEPVPGAFIGVIEKPLGDNLHRHHRAGESKTASQHSGDDQCVCRGKRLPGQCLQRRLRARVSGTMPCLDQLFEQQAVLSPMCDLGNARPCTAINGYGTGEEVIQ